MAVWSAARFCSRVVPLSGVAEVLGAEVEVEVPRREKRDWRPVSWFDVLAMVLFVAGENREGGGGVVGLRGAGAWEGLLAVLLPAPIPRPGTEMLAASRREIAPWFSKLGLGCGLEAGMRAVFGGMEGEVAAGEDGVERDVVGTRGGKRGGRAGGAGFDAGMFGAGEK